MKTSHQQITENMQRALNRYALIPSDKVLKIQALVHLITKSSAHTYWALRRPHHRHIRFVCYRWR